MPIKDPEKRRAYKAAWREKHKVRLNAIAAERREANRPAHLAYRAEWYAKHRERLRARYNEAQRGAMSRRHRGLPDPTRPVPDNCEACGTLFDGKSRRGCLDHDHTTGAFRGWLCSRCNTAIGMAGDDLAGVLRLVAYLERDTGD